jgi:hypothetical protein
MAAAFPFNAALSARTIDASAVVATRVNEFDPRRRAPDKPLFTVSKPDSLDALRLCLSVDEKSLTDEIALMTPGDLQLNFLRRHDLLTSVIFIRPGFLRWADSPFDARLLDGGALETWLAAQGCGSSQLS